MCVLRSRMQTRYRPILERIFRVVQSASCTPYSRRTHRARLIHVPCLLSVSSLADIWLHGIVLELLWQASLLLSLNFATVFLCLIQGLASQQREQALTPSRLSKTSRGPLNSTDPARKELALEVQLFDRIANISFMSLGVLDGFNPGVRGETLEERSFCCL